MIAFWVNMNIFFKLSKVAKTHFFFMQQNSFMDVTNIILFEEEQVSCVYM